MDNLKLKLKKTGLGANKKTGVIILALIIIPVAVGLLAQEQQLRNIGGNDGDVLAESRTLDVMEKLGELMELPNEEPQLATVSDVEQLRDQKFFEKARNGDVVVIFSNAQKAILYRPSTDKIIEIAVYTPPTGASQQTNTDQPTPEPTSIKSLQDLIDGPTGESDTTSISPPANATPSLAPPISP